MGLKFTKSARKHKIGRASEVGVVLEHDTYVIIHVMDLRDTYRAAYETGKRTQQ